MTYKAALIDWAGTITVSLRDIVVAAAAALELTSDDMAKAMTGLAEYVGEDDSLFHKAERGEIDDDELRAWLDTLAPGASRMFHPDHPGVLQAPDRPEVIDLMRRASDAGITVVVATNNFASGRKMLQERYLDTGLAANVVNSVDIGLRKPDPAFFAECLKTADCAASEAIFFDDMAVNLAAAADVGLATVDFGHDLESALIQARAELALS